MSQITGGSISSGPRTIPISVTVANRLSALLLAAALVAGLGLRVLRLDHAPPALHQDEACNGYDAYSILTTGRDHRGNFLPLVIQAFNDYRMPLFDYSLVPIVGAFGLKPSAVRLGAAIWGSVDIVAITILAALTLGLPGAAVAALFAALSPWQLPFSRFGQEAITASATVDLAMVCFFLWLRWRENRWLLLSGLVLGLSLYSYTITKAFTPLTIGLLGVLYWPELRQAARKAAGAIGIVLLFAAPQALMLWRHSDEIQARFRQVSVFHRGGPFLGRLEAFASGWISHFTPSYLFLHGDQTPTVMLHPPGFGHLLPEQAPLIALALVALLGRRRRRLGILLLGWLIFAALPPALTLGAPDFERDLLAFAPWTLLSAMGFVALLDSLSSMALLAETTTVLILAGTILHGARFARSYFGDYPHLAAPFFQYGVEEIVRAAAKSGDSHQPVIITPTINQPYIYVLFFERYPPALFQKLPVSQVKGLFGPVISFDRYLFLAPQLVYPKLKHGVFVFAGGEIPPAAPVLSVRYPNGRIVYNLVVK